MENLTLKDVFDLGGTGVMMFLLWNLWREYKATNERVFRYLEEARTKRHEMAAQLAAQRLAADKEREDNQGGT